MMRTACLVFFVSLAAVGCAGTRTEANPDDPGYLAAGPTTALDERGEGKPSALDLLDQRNRELAAAREENDRLLAETSRLEAEEKRQRGELETLRARCDASEKALAASEGEFRSLKEALVRSRLLNVRLSQHLARLDLFGEESESDEDDGLSPAPPENSGKK